MKIAKLKIISIFILLIITLAIGFTIGYAVHQPAKIEIPKTQFFDRPDVFIQVRIHEQTKAGEYNDAIYYPLSVLNTKTIQDIEQEKRERVKKWVEQTLKQRLTP